jgi:adenosylmethionine-8-amino-7-oxononanoate aminotransferase
MHAGLKTLRDEDGVVETRGVGLIGAVELMDDPSKRKRFAAELGVGGRLVAAAKERGLISRNIQDSYLLAPPLVTTPEQIDRIIDILRDSIREVVGWARRQKPTI